jgi:polyphosphate kinase 2 (PPK2 family)
VLAAAAAIVLFGRSWCNRAGVERVIKNPLTQRKLSPMDLQGRSRCEACTMSRKSCQSGLISPKHPGGQAVAKKVRG